VSIFYYLSFFVVVVCCFEQFQAGNSPRCRRVDGLGLEGLWLRTKEGRANKGRTKKKLT